LKSKFLMLSGGAILCGILLLSCGKHIARIAPTAREQFDIAKIDFDKKHYLPAIEGFQKVIFNYPGSNLIDTAQYFLALSYFENEEYELAGVEFSRLVSNYPRSEYVDDAQYMAGVCYFKNTPSHYGLDQEDSKKAIAAMEDFIVENPDSPLIDEARKVILEARTRLARKDYENAYLYFKLEDFKAAEIYFQLVIDNYTDTEYGAKALFKVAEIYYKQKKYPEALEKFNSFLTVYPADRLVPKARTFVEKISLKLNTANASVPSK
jgi:outer membrane protein assembly factor BamD